MNLRCFFDSLRHVQDENAQMLGDVKAEHAASARLIATAEYELELLRRDLKRGLSERPSAGARRFGDAA